jgi:RNA polymerase sigma-70 factor (ECF subfamily)
MAAEGESARAVVDDVELASRCATGDHSAQLQLFETHKSRVHATLYRILGSNKEIEDLVQDTFLEVFRSLHRYRGDARLGTWISRICSRVAFGFLSRRKPRTSKLEEVPEPLSGEQASDEVVAARQAARRLYAALDRIDSKQRIAFALHVIDGRSMKEVADMTDSSLVATKSRVWRARREVEKRAKRDPLLADYLQDQAASS